MVKSGTLWTSGEKNFRVISVSEVDGNTWVHYREDFGLKSSTLECKEYSCFLESFEVRFRQLPE